MYYLQYDFQLQFVTFLAGICFEAKMVQLVHLDSEVWPSQKVIVVSYSLFLAKSWQNNLFSTISKIVPFSSYLRRRAVLM